ncbi:MAG: outer membrane beta-barrel domain-containing protein [Desulfobacteraceae bacterium]|nr:MAG: outer membrane beta-barrel domain-containing protein [Desulfobacteraceae bacterium]
MNKRITIFILILIFLVSPVSGTCEDNDPKDPVFAIQKRIFHKSHELGLPIGYIPDDDFYQVFPVGVSYTYHFNENWAWEAARGQYFLNQEKDLKGKLETEFGVTPSAFSEPKYMIHSSLVMKPFYGKEALWNSGIMNKESYFLLGGGVVNYERQFSFGESSTENALSVSLGYGSRYFISDNLCLNLEIRDMITFKDEKTENNIFVGLTVGFRFNLSPRKSERDHTIDKLKTYIQKNNENEQ